MKVDTSKRVSICIIGFYYGIFPDWIQYWLRSCADNPTIDFLLVTDIRISDIPDNVHIISMGLHMVRQLAEQKIGIPVALERPYKLCDFKPLYGVIMEDYIEQYDYWGHCDFDLIWGDIRSFVEQYHINRYDKFLPLGHLSLYRNTKECNSYYKRQGSKCGDWITVLSSTQNHAFDELDGIYSIYESNGLPMFTKRIFAEIKTYHKRLRLKSCDGNYRHQVFYYEGGKVYRAYRTKGKMELEEFIYIHFRRKLAVKDSTSWRDIGSFYLTPDRIVPKGPGIPTKEDTRLYNPSSGLIREGMETLCFCVRNIPNIKAKIENELIARRMKRSE